MFQIEHPTDFLSRVEADRRRIERRAQLLRALRGAAPPFSETTERELRAVMREQLEASVPGSR
jgi:hypothetical protein